jgi:hypothetical protein
MVSLPITTYSSVATVVDENLYYKGVDKSVVHVARLHQHQSHSLTEPEHLPQRYSATKSDSYPNSEPDGLPPYPFTSGDTLLALTRKHNVCSFFPLLL